MKRFDLVQITKQESEQYTLLLEKLMAYRGMRVILHQNPGAATEAGLPGDTYLKTAELIKDAYKSIDRWWDTIDQKYLLIHDEDKVMMVDFNLNLIYSVDKQEAADSGYYPLLES